MATKKFSNFEYASLTDAGDAKTPGLHRFDAFETPYGHAFVVVSVDRDDEQQAELCEIAIERVKYYLENEQEEPKDIVSRNALIYSSGYLYQMGQKDPSSLAGKISCLCVLFSEEKIHYSWTGHVELFLFTGKRMYLLSWQDSENEAEGADIGRASGVDKKKDFFGSQPIIAPCHGDSSVDPVDGDILIMASGSVCRRLHTKDIKKVLQDSMPLQTKTARIMRHSEGEAGKCPACITLLRFHGLKNTERSFGAGQVTSRFDISRQKPEHTMANVKKSAKEPAMNPFRLLKLILGVIGIIVVGYFVYDLFIYDPRPPVSLPVANDVVVADTVEDLMDEDQQEEELAGQAAALPDDVVYVVRSGDTWGRIYVQYGVCSWFIINHAPNTGRFGREGSLIAGERLRIPVKYSGKAEYNPHYYQEFSTEKVGNRCEHAGRDFLRAFEEKIAD